MKVRFGGFVLDREAGRLEGPEGEVRLRPQAFRLLEVLVESAPRILSQEELLDRVWGVEHLSPASVKQAVSEVRQALGDDPARPALIETVHRRGYRFIAPLEIVEEEAPADPSEDFLSTRPITVVEILKEVTPQPSPPPVPGRRRVRRALAAGIAAALLLAFLGTAGRMLLVRRPPPPVATGSAARPAVAVLGFTNLAGDPEKDWISGALAEIVGFELAAAGKVRVIPAENVARMRRELSLAGGEPAAGSLAGIGRNLGAGLVVTGSFLVADAGGTEALRIQMMVRDVRSGETVGWARETGPPDGVLDLATAAARGLQTSLGGPGGGGVPAEAVALASSAGSLRLYARAMERLRVWDAPAALPLLEQAAAMDPGNPLVQDALAAAAARLGFDARAREAAGRALELGRSLPREVRLGLEGSAREIRGEWKEAAAIYDQIRGLHPDDLEAGLRLAAARKSAGETDLSLRTLAALRQLAAPAGEDPRIDLGEAGAAWQLGDFPRCRDAATRALRKAEARGATLLAAAARLNRGWALYRLGREEEALADMMAARQLSQKVGDRGAAAGALVAAATVFQAMNRPAEARRAYEEAIPVLREIGDRSREAKALNNFASLLGEEGERRGVIPLLERSLEIKRETGDLQGTAVTLANLANVFRVLGELRPGRERLEEALEIHRGLGDSFGVAFDLRGLARLLDKEGRPAEAIAALEEALALSRKIGDAEGTAEALLAVGDLQVRTGRLERARESYHQALGEFERLDSAANVAFTRISLAELDLKAGRLDAARGHYAQALALAGKLGNDLFEAHARDGLAQVAERQGDPGRARGEREKALALFEKLGDTEKAAETRRALGRPYPPGSPG